LTPAPSLVSLLGKIIFIIRTEVIRLDSLHHSVHKTKESLVLKIATGAKGLFKDTRYFSSSACRCSIRPTENIMR
ncbi:MAG: hypothetical protein ACTSWA_12510, partial [Candidatus Thorarchaeota archaeon]